MKIPAPEFSRQKVCPAGTLTKLVKISWSRCLSDSVRESIPTELYGQTEHRTDRGACQNLVGKQGRRNNKVHPNPNFLLGTFRGISCRNPGALGNSFHQGSSTSAFGTPSYGQEPDEGKICRTAYDIALCGMSGPYLDVAFLDPV